MNQGQKVFLELVNGRFWFLIDLHSARIDKLKGKVKRGFSYWGVRGHDGSERLGISVTTDSRGPNNCGRTYIPRCIKTQGIIQQAQGWRRRFD
jgi:hypothetical protein